MCSLVLVPGVGPVSRVDKHSDYLGSWQKGSPPPWYDLRVKVGGTFFKQEVSAGIGRNREEVHVPVDPLVVIRAIEELNLLKGAGAGKTACDSWVQAQEEVNSRGACLLWSHNEELGESITGFLLGPDIFVPLVITGILKVRPRV